MSDIGGKYLVKKKKPFYALGVMIFLGASLLLFIVAADDIPLFWRLPRSCSRGRYR
jgi:hypothetical protein